MSSGQLRVIVTALAALALGLPLVASQQQPTFRSRTDVIVVDVQVVTRDGVPVDSLKADQFEVLIDGKRRPVLSAEFIRAATAPPVRGAKTVAAPAPVTGEGRVIMLGIDQMSFPVTGQASAREAARRIVDGASPEDQIGLVAFPGRVMIAPSRDQAAVREAITQIGGLRPELQVRKYNLSASEAGLIKAKDSMTMAEVFVRECDRRMSVDPQGAAICRQEVQQESTLITTALEQQGLVSINGLHDVLDAMAQMPGRKTLAVVSAGIPLANRAGAQPNLDHELTRLARRAAAVNVNLYVFYMNIHFLRSFSAEYGKRNYSIFEDINLFGYGLEKLADGAGGSFAQVEVDADPFVDRMLRETSAYYLLSVPMAASDQDGKDHFVRVTSRQRGATLRHRKVVTIPRSGG